MPAPISYRCLGAPAGCHTLPAMSLRRTVSSIVKRARFHGSARYWERRYSTGGTSGSGSYGELAELKAAVVNRMVVEQGITSVIDFGCGDGNQLRYGKYPRYLGLDVAPSAIRKCAELFADDSSKSFILYEGAHFHDRARWLHADAALSLEVIFHLVEDNVFDLYMRHLFDTADRQVIICATDRDDLPSAPQERHRPFSRWIADNRPGWTLAEHVPLAAAALASDVFRYEREGDGSH